MKLRLADRRSGGEPSCVALATPIWRSTSATKSSPRTNALREIRAMGMPARRSRLMAQVPSPVRLENSSSR